jgi:preprotein translocase subunit SecG
MELFVVSLHIVLCIAMILIILLQPGKGGDVGAAFGGGGSSSMFGPRGPASLLSKATTGAAVLFMMTCMTLAWYANQNNKGRAGVETIQDQGQDLFGPASDEPSSDGTPENTDSIEE